MKFSIINEPNFTKKNHSNTNARDTKLLLKVWGSRYDITVSVAGMASLSISCCTDSTVHRIDQTVDCYHWNVIPLLY